MKTKYGIPGINLMRIRERDTLCVYCRKFMPEKRENAKFFATIEHLYPPGNDPTWVCYCCNSCNASHKMPLREWFKTKYCLTNNINEKTVAPHIKRFLESGLKEYDQMWVDAAMNDFISSARWEASTPESGPEFLTLSNLNDSEKSCFDRIANEIRKPGFIRWYPNRDPKFSRYDGYEYWLENDFIFRRKFEADGFGVR